MNENLKKELASPELPVKWNKFLKLVFIYYGKGGNIQVNSEG